MALEDVKQEGAMDLSKFPGVPVSGNYRGSEEIVTQYGKTQIHTMIGEDGKTFQFWGSKFTNDTLKNARKGEFYAFTFIEKSKNKRGQPLSIIKVQIDREKYKAPTEGEEIPF